MKDKSIDTEKLLKEHEESFERIEKLDSNINSLLRLKAEWIPGKSYDWKQKLGELEQSLAVVHSHLQEHMAYEEKNLLPLLVENAANIISRAIPYQHKKILTLIAELRENLKSITDEPTNRQEMIEKEMAIHSYINAITTKLRGHMRVQEVIFKLFNESLN